MKCQYPNCRSQSWWVPVVALPTVRSSSTSDELVQTDKPTYLLFPEVCHAHKASYNLAYWFPPAQWRELKRLAESKGYAIPELAVMPVSFQPTGWEPSMRWMEMERG